MITAVEATDGGLVVTTNGQPPQLLSWRWVRDHGEDAASYDPATKQRRVYAIGEAPPRPAASAQLNDIDGQAVVELSWPDAPDSSWITVSSLEGLMMPAARDVPAAWRSPDQPTFAVGEVDEVLRDDAALAGWLGDLAANGFAVLRGFSGGHDAVTALANRIGYPRATIFGATWDLASDIDHHDDTAYSQSFLAPHTDGTYSHEAPGLQMFCCIERDGTGGESIVVDGFAIAETLRTDFPDDFEVLTRVSVPAHYIEPGVELRASRPALRQDASGAVVQISMNNYDRSPMLLPSDEMDAFYRAYGRLHELANDSSRWMSIGLEAGDVLINDNWRALHGRQAYTGARRFIGCYLNHEDFESRCRTLGVNL